MTILVVEDDRATREILRLALVIEGYEVVEAATGTAALSAAQRALPDLVLQTLALPDMDGAELLRRLRGLSGGSELPIVALSGFLSRLAQAQTVQDGFTALFVKPIEPNGLLNAIRACLPQPKALRPARFEGRRLLVVDDDPVQLKLVRIHFAHLGFDVTATTSAEDALLSARTNRPEVVVSDVFMPGTDGFELCLAIRTDPSLASVPVVLVSAHYGSEADQEMARRVGASALVLRTPDFGCVLPAVLKALEARAPAPSEPPSDQLALTHARLVIHQLEQQAAATAALTRQSGILTSHLSLFTGVADTLSRKVEPTAALRDVIASTLEAAGISKGALLSMEPTGALTVQGDIGFSDAERTRLQDFFGHRALLEAIITNGDSVAVPSPAIPDIASQEILGGARVATAHIVPLTAGGRGAGAMLIGATRADVSRHDAVLFARTMGNQVVQSLELARSVTRLSASERRYRALMENAGDFIAVLTPEGIVREMSHRWVDFTGLPLEQLVGRNVREFAPPGKEDETDRAYQTVLSTNGGSTLPIELATPGGSTALIEFSSTTIEGGGEDLVFTIGRDITEREQALKVMRAGDERTRCALQTANIGIWDLDYATGVLRWSAVLESHYGLAPGASGGTFEALVKRVHPEDRQTVLETIERAAVAGSDFSIPHRTIWPDGAIRWLNGTGHIHLDEQGAPRRAIGISQDVTGRRELEK